MSSNHSNSQSQSTDYYTSTATTTTTTTETEITTRNTTSTTLPPTLEALLLLDAYHKRHTVGQEMQKDCVWNLQKARRTKNTSSLGLQSDFGLTAELVREEIYPRIQLYHDIISTTKSTNTNAVAHDNDDNIAALVDEPLQDSSDKATTSKETTTSNNTDSNTNPTMTNHFQGHWTLKDPVQIAAIATQKKEKSVLLPLHENENHQNLLVPLTDGLRQRKGANKNNTVAHKNNNDKEQWTTELLLTQDDDDNNDNDREQLLLRTADPIDLFGALPPRDLRMAQAKAQASIQAYVEAANFAMQILTLLPTTNTTETKNTTSNEE